MKTYVLVSALLCLAVCVRVHAGKYDVKDGRHNITMGSRRIYPMFPVDILLIHDNPRLSSSMLRVQSHDVCYPSPGSNTASKFSITAFNVTDLMPQETGGYAFVTKGGINSGILCLHLKTQRGEGYNFNIDIWGYYI